MNKKKAWSFMYAPSDAVNAPVSEVFFPWGGGEGTWVFFGGYVPPGTPNSYPVLKKNSPKIDAPF